MKGIDDPAKVEDTLEALVDRVQEPTKSVDTHIAGWSLEVFEQLTYVLTKYVKDPHICYLTCVLLDLFAQTRVKKELVKVGAVDSLRVVAAAHRAHEGIQVRSASALTALGAASK